MRRFKISVDGVAYDVAVEELEQDSKSAPAPAKEMPIHTTSAPAAPPPVPPKAPPASTASTNSGDVVSPLAGTVIEVKVSAGQTVKSGDILLVLEAMKMESMIVAPIDGRVQSIAVSPGQSVQEGFVMLSLTAV
ncbi:MAG: biotin/lipoyl-binding protein [Gammaproteobacteria bacterium]|nr:biotin/lipoyl-binding protein [Gammaproteobacteria bacterium]